MRFRFFFMGRYLMGNIARLENGDWIGDKIWKKYESDCIVVLFGIKADSGYE